MDASNSGSESREINTAVWPPLDAAITYNDNNGDSDSSAYMMSMFDIVPKGVEKNELGDCDASGQTCVVRRDGVRPGKTAPTVSLEAVEPAAVMAANYGPTAEADGARGIGKTEKTQLKTASRSSRAANGRPSQLLVLNNSSKRLTRRGSTDGKSLTEDVHKCIEHGMHNNVGSCPQECAGDVEDGLAELKSCSATKDIHMTVECLLETAINHDDKKCRSGSSALVASAVAIIPKKDDKDEPGDDAEAGEMVNLGAFEPAAQTVSNVRRSAELEVERWIKEALPIVVATSTPLFQNVHGVVMKNTQRGTTVALANDDDRYSAEAMNSSPVTTSMVGPAAVTAAKSVNLRMSAEEELEHSVEKAPSTATSTVRSFSGRSGSSERNIQSSTITQSTALTVKTAARRAPASVSSLTTDADNKCNRNPRYAAAIIPCTTGGNTDPELVGKMAVEETSGVGASSQTFAETTLENDNEKPWTRNKRNIGEVAVSKHEGDDCTKSRGPGGATNTATYRRDNSFAEVGLELNEPSRYADGTRGNINLWKNSPGNTRYCRREVEGAPGWTGDPLIVETDCEPSVESGYLITQAADQRLVGEATCTMLCNV